MMKYKQTEIGLIPKTWNLKLLDNLCTKIGSGITPRGGSNIYQNTGRPFLRSQNIGWGQLLLDDIVYISNQVHATFINTEIKKDDVFLNITGASIGRSSYANEKLIGGNVNQHVCIIRTTLEIHSIFLNKILLSQIGQSQIDSFQSGGNREGLNIGQIKSFLIPLPPLPEQEAIVEVLSDTDELIQALEKRIAKKKLIKKGAMQELLTPKDDWEVKKLGEVCDIKKGQLITSDTKVEGVIPVIAGGKKPAYFHNKPNRNGKQITVSGSGANAGFVSFHNYPIFASDCSTIGESKKYKIEYIYYLLMLFQKDIYNKQTGGAQPHIHPSDLNPIEIPFPPIQEQTHIANILSDMDNETKALENKLSKTKKLKKALMQQLLTGKIRLVD